MAKPIDTFQKTNDENPTEPRAEKLYSGDDEQSEHGGRWLSDEEFFSLLDKSQFGTENISAEILFGKFYENAESAFFQSFRDRKKMSANFRRNFGDASAQFFIEKAEKIIAGRFDLPGFENLDFGAEIDWHFEPTSGRRSPLKHWKQFDGFSINQTGDAPTIRQLNRCRHFFSLGVAFWMTGDERFAETFARHLESWIKQNPTGTGINWSSSSEVALRSMSWIWALQFFKNSAHFTSELFLKALKSLYLHASHVEKYLSTYISPNTHLTGEALGLYCLGTQLPFFERAAVWRETGEKILLAELDRQILPDGVYFERSIGHQRCTTDFYTQFLILKQLNGGEKNPDSRQKLDEKLQSSLDFLMAVARPDGTTPLVEDDGGRCLPLSNAAPNDFRAALSTGATIFSRGDYKFAAERLSEETFWLLGDKAVESFENLQTKTPAKNSFAFKDGGYFVMRDGWTETDNYLLIDCGNFGATNGARGHADALSIDAAIGGKTLLADSESYAPGESDAAGNHFRSTEARNTLTIDEQRQSEPTSAALIRQTKAKTNLHGWISQERFDFFEGSHDGCEKLSGAFSAKHTRSVLFLKNDYWIMRDFVEIAGEHRYALNFHFATDVNPAIETTENGVCVGEKSGESVGSRLFSFGDNALWEKKESSISSVGDNRRAGAPFLKFVSKGVGSQEFFTFLLPRETGFAAPEISEVSVLGGRAFVVSYRAYKDIFVFADGGGQIVRTELFNTNFRFFWARLSEGEDLPEEFVLIGGNYFSLGNREIINHLQPLEAATARRFGSRLSVRTPESVFSISLPQKKSSTYVLKNKN